MLKLSRRAAIATAAAASAWPATSKPALLGGAKIRTTAWPKWPVFGKEEEDALAKVLKSAVWNRSSGKVTAKWEEDYAKLTGAKACLATANGTSALLTSLSAMGVGAGDEVIVPPYTFVATINVVLALHAVPVFVDSDRESMQIDAKKIEAAITDRTAAIMPVHMGGAPADLDAILAIARKRNIPVVEDACQAHLGEWRNKKVGTYGLTGCFSFQASKNLNSGEGGAILSNDSELIEKCYAFHNNSRGRVSTGYNFAYVSRGNNLRMTEFQGALLSAQMTRLEAQTKLRRDNAAYLTSLLSKIPGVLPAKLYSGCTGNAWHLYMWRYQPEKFAGLPRAKFLKALSAEGIPASAGYSPLNKEPFLVNTLHSRGYQRIHSKEQIAKWEHNNRCPENDKLCQEAVWFTQNILLTDHASMDQIAEAIARIQANAPDLNKG
ncbi:MAG: DegT/DnrJ/EryC1/StrS family aminotransferase [Acidobacteria bacterium]|nr:DegT/DnrJ/EryC1/StrS family aminotransferase [Acidobacteriota bacterium]